jgi:hypothetical protein
VVIPFDLKISIVLAPTPGTYNQTYEQKTRQKDEFTSFKSPAIGLRIKSANGPAPTRELLG